MTTEQPAIDAVQHAMQLGRLDLLTAVLAGLALMIALGTFPLFTYLKLRAEQVAREEARKALDEAKQKIENEAIAYMEAMLPSMVADYAELAKASNGGSADDIAAAQEDAGDGNDIR